MSGRGRWRRGAWRGTVSDAQNHDCVITRQSSMSQGNRGSWNGEVQGRYIANIERIIDVPGAQIQAFQRTLRRGELPEAVPLVIIHVVHRPRYRDLGAA